MMVDTERAKVYVRQLVEDEYVQDQLRNAAAGLRDVYERTRRQRAQATEDKRLYANLRRAATSIRNAATALRKAPEPEPKQRHLGRVVVIVAVVGGTVWLTRKMQKAARESDGSVTEPATAPAPETTSPPPPEPAPTFPPA